MKFLKYAFLVLGCLVWAAGLSPALLSEAGKLDLIKDSYRFGDLYRLSNLAQFKDPRTECTAYRTPAKTASQKTHLYIIGDSFTEAQRVGKKDFAVDAYTYVHWNEFLHLKTDPSETNILLLESVERHFREKMKDTIRNLIPDHATFVSKGTPPRFMNRLDNAFKSRSTEDRLDELLFQNDVILTLKEWKSAFNYRFFSRVNKGVTLINNDENVVYYMDTDTPNMTSSFSKVNETEIDSMVQNINASQDFARNLGFDHVILSIIPNKVSVLTTETVKYNNLIKRIYTHPELKMPFIDVLTDFRKMGSNAYLKGDSHWTCEGQYLWLDKVNAFIKTIEKPANS
ncbi:hypothetical protein [Dyadobacter sediminis]|uniref:AlgX/AlgJ SGNH hydrolase-like domain-containing protein n=1 Tax=Dyadobacter sediminis TaxID=1493691 RepID=A0A5R9KAW8_9BACT|nr:hypothetical protein [Dyadobacter sediminis]TLU91892.1 hypothetical protein FEM55_14060 [Dyadobacter sediminis]GGB99416.1 hypothetical protein GCM10011325_28240 [Dyadobacter sediminis]